jgi:hypothetical protein
VPKATNFELQNRVREIYKLMVAGYSYPDIVEYSTKKWGVGTRAVDQYRARARDLMGHEIDPEIERMRSEQLARYQKIFNKTCVDPKTAHIALGALKGIDKLLGLETTIARSLDAALNLYPDKIEIIGIEPDTEE